MHMHCPEGVGSINVAGVEYTADAVGVVHITDPVHIAVAEQNGFTTITPTGE